ncbi:heavy-metal-associated domain-containing protein [Leucobacter weissii]|uniref:Heavy-metal-associated domain-containing protein n=1 Tax=Leucobacter weissii TaxID=1983706 RepID=A0A939MME8_9MICO|nr:heavy-metal-associated domain-containing protein [Leucobacter weissii]MBO1901472.1 heavy-metal-associated domain-containing protein [Leucobacter weissii]
MTTAEYTVAGMTCANCERHVREEVAEIPGVTSAVADRATGRLTVTGDGTAIPDRAVIAAVAEAGYTAARA